MWGTVHKTFYENVSKSIFGNVSVTETFQKHFPKMFLKQKRTRNVLETFQKHFQNMFQERRARLLYQKRFSKAKQKCF